MDNQTPNSQNEWVDRKLAGLVPPVDWHPNSKRALAQLLKRKDRPEAEGSVRWVRLSMTAAVLASIGLVVALLPWQALWSETKSGKNLTPESQKAATPELVPEPTPNYSDEARRLHIQGTAATVQQTAPPPTEQEQKPVERVGPGVTPPIVISPMTEPDYTDEARKAHIQGTVVLSVIVRADGTGKVDKVIRSLGYGLDQKAIETFEKWRFAPAKKDGKPVDVQLQVTMSFKLN